VTTSIGETEEETSDPISDALVYLEGQD